MCVLAGASHWLGLVGSRIKLLSLSSTEPSKKRVVLKGSSEAATSPNTPEKPSRKDSSLQKSTPSAEPARASLPAKIPKPPENTVRKPTELTFEALPEKIKLKCMESDVPLQQYKDDIELLYDCAKFIYGAEFGISKLECRTTGKITTYASEELVEFGSEYSVISTLIHFRDSNHSCPKANQETFLKLR